MKKEKSKGDLPVILIAFKEGGENGGPYTSHKRILNSINSDKYQLKPFFFPRSRVIFSPKGLKNLVKQIKAEDAVGMHIVGLQLEGFVAMIVCKLAKIKILLAIHGSEAETTNLNRIKKSLLSILEYFTVKNSDIVYGVSNYVCNWPICKYSKYMIGTIYNLPPFKNDCHLKCNLRQKLGIKDHEVVVVSTGRIVKEKGFDILTEVIKKFNSIDNISFIIAGDGNYKKEMECIISKSEMKEKVHFLGYRKDINNILSSSDIFIICTKHETLCMSLQEAGINGLPLIATNVGGIPEVFDESCGFLIENLDIDGFANAIKTLKDNKDMRVRMGINAKNKIMSDFDPEVILSKLNKAYLMLIDNDKTIRR